jgi:hypothetical protein
MSSILKHIPSNCQRLQSNDYLWSWCSTFRLRVMRRYPIEFSKNDFNNHSLLRSIVSNALMQSLMVAGHRDVRPTKVDP